MKKIVLIEDDCDLYALLQYNLEKEGFQMTGSKSGKGAIELCRAFGPDLILLDIMLPQKNGFEVCQKIRENPAWNGIKVVMLTAKGRESEVTKGLALGADAYITKPFATRELLATVQRLLGE